MSDQRLEDVFVEVEPEDAEFEIVDTVPCKSLPYNTPSNTYVLIRLPDSSGPQSTVFTNILKFTVKDADSEPADSGLPDEYEVMPSLKARHFYWYSYIRRTLE